MTKFDLYDERVFRLRFKFEVARVAVSQQRG